MKTWRVWLVIVTVFVTTLAAAGQQKPATGEPVPKYDKSTEATFKGAVEK
jgi:hypothetical protein